MFETYLDFYPYMLGEMILNLTCTYFFSDGLFNHQLERWSGKTISTTKLRRIQQMAAGGLPTQLKTYDELGQKGEGVSFLVGGDGWFRGLVTWDPVFEGMKLNANVLYHLPFWV